MILAWLLLLTGLTISAVAIYYSVVGLTAIFSAAVIPIIVMGSALEVAKLVCASWLKANWERAPVLLKTYMSLAVVILMLITSMGIFGFLSKAHNDQNLVSGDVQSKIAVYDEKIKTAKENIDANRKALKQMDEAVDQVMGRSADEKGADKAVALRRGQAKERTRLLSEITAEQKAIAQLSEERAPIAAEVRKVEAEVGPIKYIAKFIYGDDGANENMLEKAVTWIIILIVVVFDPLAVIMLLGAQMTFAWHRNGHDPLAEETPDPYIADVGEKPTQEELKEIEPIVLHPKQFVDHGEHPKDTFEHENEHIEEVPNETPSTALGGDITAPEETVVENTTTVVSETTEPVAQEEFDPVAQWNELLAKVEEAVKAEDDAKAEEARKYHPIEPDLPERPGDYLVVTGDRIKPDLTEIVETEDSKKKTYMIKDQTGQMITREKK